MAPKLSGKKEGSFAYRTVRDRWPQIITKLVNDLSTNKRAIIEMYGPEADEDVRAILEKFSRLRYRIMTDKSLDTLNDNEDDVHEWNEFLLNNRTREIPDDVEQLTWFGGPWLFVECFLYRYIYGAFAATRKLKKMDYFEDSKRTNFNDHLEQIEESSAFIMKISAEDAPVHELFGINTFLKMSLWGNRADMSLTGGENAIVRMSAMSASSKLAEFVLVDDVNELIVKVLAPLLMNPENYSTRRIDIILDNAGVELAGDFVLAEFLISRGYADKVVMHGKMMPWFVSDVTERDFEWTLLAFSRAGVESARFGERLKKRVADNQLEFKTHKFWTFPHAYYKMEEVAPDLHSELKTSSLAIFKGDLNYPCRGFAPCPFFALRILKAETVAGLSKKVLDDILMKFDEDNGWMISGTYAVCQLGGI
ncbi:unnamed protein product [Caenorhabditis sp. 36 PRJEB53466]|nr:unnamed protein product [Caenorhabditis sp. 36 PRJEB53466]